MLASAIVMKLQPLVSRESSPLDPAVVTVGSFHAGAKHNIIPDEARLQLTVRSYSDESRKLLLDGIARIARGEALAAGMPEERMPRVSVEETFTPATYNDPAFAEKIAAAFKDVAAVVQADGDDLVGIGNDRQEFDVGEAVIGAFARCRRGDFFQRIGGNRLAQGLRSTRQGRCVDDAVVGDDAKGFGSID